LIKRVVFGKVILENRREKAGFEKIALEKLLWKNLAQRNLY